MVLVKIIIEFLKIGLFSIGGGLATIPFLYELSHKYQWFSLDELSQMIAIAESSPGPIGINMATYVGYRTYHILGAILATTSIVFPSVVIIIIIANWMVKFKTNKFYNFVFKYLRAVSFSLILIILVKLISKAFSLDQNINLKAIYILVLLTLFKQFYKKASPMVIIGLAIILGLIFRV